MAENDSSVLLEEMIARLEHLNRVTRAVRGVSQLIIHARTPAELARRACDCLVETRGYFNAWIALLEENQKGHSAFASNLDAEFEPMVEALREGRLTRCAAKALASSEVIVTADPKAACDDCPLSSAYAGRGGMTVRLACGERVYGVLSVSVPKSLVVDAEERDLLVELAEDLGHAFHSMEEAEKRREAEKALHLHRHITMSLPQPMSFVDRSYRYQAINEAYARFHGKEPDGIVGRGVEEIHGTEVFEKEIKPRFDRCLAGEDIQYEVEVDFPSRGISWMEMRHCPCRDEQGRITGVVTHGIEVTDRVRARQEELERNQERHELAMNAARDGLWDWDVPSGQVRYSPGWGRILGLDSCPHVFETWESRIHREDREGVLGSLRRHLSGEIEEWREEHRLRAKSANGDGSWVEARWSGATKRGTPFEWSGP